MISENLAEKYALGSLAKYRHSTREYYEAFLSVTDYVVIKAMEAQLLGDDVEQYQEVLEARRYARQMINAIDDGTYTGEEAGTDIDIFYADEEGEAKT